MINMEELELKYQKNQQQFAEYYKRRVELMAAYDENSIAFQQYDLYKIEYKKYLLLYDHSSDILIAKTKDFAFSVRGICIYLFLTLIVPYVWLSVMFLVYVLIQLVVIFKDFVSLQKTKKTTFEYRLKKREIEQYLLGDGRQLEMKRTYLWNEIQYIEYQLKFVEKKVSLYKEAIEQSKVHPEQELVYTKEQLETLRKTAILTKKQLQEKIDLVFDPKKKTKSKCIDTFITKDKGNIM